MVLVDREDLILCLIFSMHFRELSSKELPCGLSCVCKNDIAKENIGDGVAKPTLQGWLCLP